MIKFMILGAPRSGTAWASVWTGALHDPLWDYFYEDLDKQDVGISCTASAIFRSWVDRHSCPKVILHRPMNEVQMSLQKAGIPTCNPVIFNHLEAIKGLHVTWTDLFKKDTANTIWEWLNIPTTFDIGRHRELANLRITTQFDQRRNQQDPSVRSTYANHGIIIRP